jgi:hypothetical protein
MEQLLATQAEDGSWPAAAFCIDPVRGGATHYHGSAALTTALAVEALWTYQISNLQAPRPESDVVPGFDYNRTLERQVLAMADTDCRQLGKAVRAPTLAYLKRLTESTNGREIIGLGEAFSNSFKQQLAMPTKLFAQLGLANLYGWAAYTIYDDFLDDEGQPALLPTANVALRYALEAFEASVSKDPAFQGFVHRTFDIIDNANAWEQTHCRFQYEGQKLVVAALPEFGDLQVLAERSLGHCLAPLAVLCLSGQGTDSAAFRHTEAALRHYLIARQLNDDAHDWQEDLQLGHGSYVVTCLLIEAGVSPGSYSQSVLLPALRQQFWYETLPSICRTIQQQVMLSRHHLKKLTLLESTNIITQLLDGIAASVEETLATQEQARRFLKQYSGAGQAII